MANKNTGGRNDRETQEAKAKEYSDNLAKAKAVAGKTQCLIEYCYSDDWKSCIKNAKYFYGNFPVPPQPKNKIECQKLAYNNFKNLKLFLATTGSVQSGTANLLKELDNEITGLKDTQKEKAEAQNLKLLEEISRMKILLEERVKDLIPITECFSWQNILALAVKGIKDKILSNKKFNNELKKVIEKEFSNIDTRFSEINKSFYGDDGKNRSKKL